VGKPFVPPAAYNVRIEIIESVVGPMIRVSVSRDDTVEDFEMTGPDAIKVGTALAAWVPPSVPTMST
jgi:hypothetical protein